jgi:hypothetical protein
MTSRLAGLVAFGVVVVLIGSFTLQRSFGWDASEQSSKQRPDRQGAQQARKERQNPQPPGPGPHLAFDVRPRDHQRTTRYLLEVTHPSGELTTHDLKKPPLQRRTIMVPIPELTRGKYQLVVIAEFKDGPATRSKPLPFELSDQ